MNWADHLIVLPVVLPLATSALIVFVDERRYRLKATISIASLLAMFVVAGALLRLAEAPRVYTIGDWPAPFGIVLVADRLAAALVLLAVVLALAASVFSLVRWQRAGPRWHALVQFQLMGLCGAFLTGDLFNLFVFFELMLAASYGLVLYGSGLGRVRAGLHYIVINLVASLFFLVGVSLIYGVAGTLNMADLALRLPALAGAERPLAQAGAAVLAVAFLVKAGMWPLGFWLPSTYAAASPPAAALLSILSKVGVYAVLRLWLLFFGDGEGGVILAWGGMATLAFAIAGVLATQDLGRLAGHSLLASSGALLAAIGLGSAAATGAALYYLVASTLGIAALFLLIELAQRARAPGADVLALTAEAFGLEGADEPEEDTGVAIPATMALLGLAFAACALLLAGLPPLPGFVGKFALLAALLAPAPVAAPVWTLLALLLLSGLASLVAMTRAGMSIFWASEERSAPRVNVLEMAPVVALLALCLALTVAADPVMRYMQEAAAALHAPHRYIDAALGRR
ncbi:MAG: monovalent cation/H+ antiporter subunit D [Burkholderiales bacterium]|nr:monovalent cation/H+ antiporter subunit D [Burkholderiales bacterium]